MGFFSWRCAKCGLPVINHYAGGVGEPNLNAITVLTPDGDVLHGHYDGYGRMDVDDGPSDYGDVFDISELVEWEDEGEGVEQREPCVLHTCCYSEGDTYEEVGQSRSDPAQGFFYGPDQVEWVRDQVKRYLETGERWEADAEIPDDQELRGALR